MQTDGVDDRSASSSRIRTQRLKKGRIPAMPAMGRPPVWPHDHGLSGDIRPDVVGQPKGDAIRRTYDTDTLYDVVTIFARILGFDSDIPGYALPEGRYLSEAFA